MAHGGGFLDYGHRKRGVGALEKLGGQDRATQASADDGDGDRGRATLLGSGFHMPPGCKAKYYRDVSIMSIILVDLSYFVSAFCGLPGEVLKGRGSQVVRQGSAKPSRTVRFCPAPPAVSPRILLLEMLLSLPAGPCLNPAKWPNSSDF